MIFGTWSPHCIFFPNPDYCLFLSLALTQASPFIFFIVKFLAMLTHLNAIGNVRLTTPFEVTFEKDYFPVPICEEIINLNRSFQLENSFSIGYSSFLLNLSCPLYIAFCLCIFKQVH